jgi:hypothetical protein
MLVPQEAEEVNMARRKYYKVVRVNWADQFMSAWIQDSQFELCYSLGEVTRPRVRGTGVTVFNTLEQAQEWARRGDCADRPDVVLEGIGDRMRRPRHRCHALMGCLDSGDVIRVWTGRSTWFGTSAKWPEGTLALSWFKPERIVE